MFSPRKGGYPFWRTRLDNSKKTGVVFRLGTLLLIKVGLTSQWPYRSFYRDVLPVLKIDLGYTGRQLCYVDNRESSIISYNYPLILNSLVAMRYSFIQMQTVRHLGLIILNQIIINIFLR